MFFDGVGLEGVVFGVSLFGSVLVGIWVWSVELVVEVVFGLECRYCGLWVCFGMVRVWGG